MCEGWTEEQWRGFESRKKYKRKSSNASRSTAPRPTPPDATDEGREVIPPAREGDSAASLGRGGGGPSAPSPIVEVVVRAPVPAQAGAGDGSAPASPPRPAPSSSPVPSPKRTPSRSRASSSSSSGASSSVVTAGQAPRRDRVSPAHSQDLGSDDGSRVPDRGGPAVPRDQGTVPPVFQPPGWQTGWPFLGLQGWQSGSGFSSLPSSYFRFLAWEREREEERERSERSRRASATERSSRSARQRSEARSSSERSRSRSRHGPPSGDPVRDRAPARSEGERSSPRSPVPAPRPQVRSVSVQAGEERSRPVGIDVGVQTVLLPRRSVACSTCPTPVPVLVSTGVGEEQAFVAPVSPGNTEATFEDEQQDDDSGDRGRPDLVDLDDTHAPPDEPAQQKEYGFEDVVRFIRDAHDMGEMKEVRAKPLPSSAFARKSAKEVPTSLDFSLPLSPLLVGIREETNATLAEMAESCSYSTIPAPRSSDRKYYRPERAGFDAPLQARSNVTSLTATKKVEMNKTQVSVSHSLLSSFEVASSSMAEGASWMDWWVASVSDFKAKLPVEDRAFFQRLLESGSKGIEMFARMSVFLYSNFMLLHRDAVVSQMPSTVPQDQLALLRNAVLPLSDSLFPSDLVATVVEKRRLALHDTALQRALHPSKIPRVPSRGRESVGSQPGTSGVAVGAAGSPVVPPGNASRQTSTPPPAPRGRKKKKKSSDPFHRGSSLPVQGEAKGKGRGKI